MIETHARDAVADAVCREEQRRAARDADDGHQHPAGAAQHAPERHGPEQISPPAPAAAAREGRGMPGLRRPGTQELRRRCFQFTEEGGCGGEAAHGEEGQR